MRAYRMMLWLLICSIPLAADGAIINVDPFVGDLSDDMTYAIGGRQTLSTFDGHVTLNNLTQGGAIKVEMSSTFNGDQVLPRSSPTMMGQLGIMEWVFHTPISQIGGYFENNSRVDDVVFEFFDAQDQLIGTRVATVSATGQTWTWNGWKSDVAIHRIVSTGNDGTLLNGFIWYDDMQLNQVPEPNGFVLAAIALISVVVVRRVHRRRAG